MEKKNKFEIDVPWYAVALVVLVIIGVGLWFAFHSAGTANYKGLVFQAEKYGSTVLYHYSYFFTNSDGEVAKYNLYLHNNPNKNNVPNNAEIIYPLFKEGIKLSINTTGLTNCSDSSMSIGLLSDFLINNGFKVTPGTTNMTLAKENNLTYITCETNPNDFVISIEQGNKTQIVQQGNCYRIEASNCEILPAVEKFVTDSIAQAKERNPKGL